MGPIMEILELLCRLLPFIVSGDNPSIVKDLLNTTSDVGSSKCADILTKDRSFLFAYSDCRYVIYPQIDHMSLGIIHMVSGFLCTTIHSAAYVGFPGIIGM